MNLVREKGLIELHYIIPHVDIIKEIASTGNKAVECNI